MAKFRWPGDPPGKGRHSISWSAYQKRRIPGKKTTAARPPAGSYDSGLDAQERAARRGYFDQTGTGQDIDTAQRRSSEDYGLANTEYGRQKGDVNRQYGENLSDLLQARTRAGEDYNTNLQTLARNYQRLGGQQAQSGARAGLEGGFAAQAARKRAANQAIERKPLDTEFQRFQKDSTTSEERLLQGQQRDIGAIDRAGAQTGLDYTRGSEDLSTQRRRSGTEFQAYLQDISAARQQQYGGALPTSRVWSTKQRRQAKRMTARRKARRGGI